MHHNLVEFRIRAASTLKSSKELPEFRAAILTLVQSLGFSDFDYSVISTLTEVECLMNSIPDSLMKTYLSEGLHEHDHLLDYMKSYSAPVFQSTLDQKVVSPEFSQLERSQKNRLILELIRSYGFQDSFSIPVSIFEGKEMPFLTVFHKNSSAAELRHKVGRCITELCLLANTIQALGSYLFPHYFLPGKKKNENHLSQQQINILISYAKYDESAQKVAKRFGITRKTVEYHLEQVKRKLGAISIPNAVYLAIQKGLISVHDAQETQF